MSARRQNEVAAASMLVRSTNSSTVGDAVSEIPLPMSDQDDTEAHCLGVRLSDIEAAERQQDTIGRTTRIRGAEVNGAEGDDSGDREIGVHADVEAEPEDVSGHVQPRRDLGR